MSSKENGRKAGQLTCLLSPDVEVRKCPDRGSGGGYAPFRMRIDLVL